MDLLSRGHLPGRSFHIAQHASRMFPVRAADIAPRDRVFPRSRSAAADGREGVMGRQGLRPYPIGTGNLKLHTSTKLPPSLPYKTPHIWEFQPRTSRSVGPSTEKTSAQISTIKLKLSFTKNHQKVDSPLSVDASGFRPSESNTTCAETVMRLLAPRIPAGHRRASSASHILLKSKLLAQRDSIPTKPAFVLQRQDTSGEELGAANPECKPIPNLGLCLEPKVEGMFAPQPPKPFSPISAWKEPRSRSAAAPKRTCFREDVDIIYFDTEEKPTESQERDSEKLKDENETEGEEEDEPEKGNEENEEPKSEDLPFSPAQSSNYSTPSSTTQPVATVAARQSMTKLVVGKNVCFKQEIRLLPNTEDARENLIRRDSCTLSVIVQIAGCCIKQMTSVKAMSGGRSLVVVTHRPGEDRSLMARHNHPASADLVGSGDPSLSDGSMILIQHIDRMRLPVEINPYAVKAHIHKDWTLRIEAPVRDWLDCPCTVLRCRLPLGAQIGLEPRWEKSNH